MSSMGITANKDKKTYGRSVSAEEEEEENSAEDELHDTETRKVSLLIVFTHIQHRLCPGHSLNFRMR